MQITSFYDCCTAMIISGFGGSAVSSSFYGTTKQQIIDYIKTRAATHSGVGLFVITLNYGQTLALETLRELGAEESEGYTKEQHPYTELKWLGIHSPALLEKSIQVEV